MNNRKLERRKRREKVKKRRAIMRDRNPKVIVRRLELIKEAMLKAKEKPS